MYEYEYPKASIVTDIVVCHFPTQSIILIERGGEPFRSKLALPGGFMNMDETLLQCAQRELLEETGISPNLGCWRQATIADKIDRDVRGRTISVVYEYHVYEEAITFSAHDDAANCNLYKISDIPHDMAFDHHAILEELGIFSPAWWC